MKTVLTHANYFLMIKITLNLVKLFKIFFNNLSYKNAVTFIDKNIIIKVDH